jgi:hypothetical protein
VGGAVAEAGPGASWLRRVVSIDWPQGSGVVSSSAGRRSRRASRPRSPSRAQPVSAPARGSARW